MTIPERVDGYLPLGSYGIIGDCRSAALVGRDGSIDWLCLPRFDHPSIFGRLLDAERGGHWQLQPRGPYTVWQRYRDRSNILETVYSTRSGRVVVTDFMPVTHGRLPEHATLNSEPRVVRLVDCVAGEMTLLNVIEPRPGYGNLSCVFESGEDVYHGDTKGMHVCIRSTVPLPGPRNEMHVQQGDCAAFGLVTTRRRHCPKRNWTVVRARALRDATRDFWWNWIGRCTYRGPYEQPVWRSALALKLMTYSPTGAIVAAPTTSLPERLGGDRNWDYRFTWLRDAAFTLYAFFQLGFTDEAEAFFRWLVRIGIGRAGVSLENLYDLDGVPSAPERELPWLSGHRGSRPVRVGNAAARQRQLDVYGEVLDSAYLYARFGGEIGPELWESLRAVVEMAIAQWEQPDASIWEGRSENQHFTYSKLMCWVAVDRGLRLARRYGLAHDELGWKRARTAIKRCILGKGWSAKLGAFTQTLGGVSLDAAVLRMSQARLLSDTDPRMVSTVQVIQRELGAGALVSRYRTDEHDDGVGGTEGAFLMCSFWLVDALAHMGDVQGAQHLFDQLLSFSSPLGLFSEECDPRTGELLGNFPQAFTHLALVGAAVNMERARHRRLGPQGLSQRAGGPRGG